MACEITMQARNISRHINNEIATQRSVNGDRCRTQWQSVACAKKINQLQRFRRYIGTTSFSSCSRCKYVCRIRSGTSGRCMYLITKGYWSTRERISFKSEECESIRKRLLIGDYSDLYQCSNESNNSGCAVPHEILSTTPTHSTTSIPTKRHVHT